MRLIALSFCGRGLSVRSSGGQCAILDSSRKRLDWWSCVVVMMTGGGGHQVCIDILIKVTPFALLILILYRVILMICWYFCWWNMYILRIIRHAQRIHEGQPALIVGVNRLMLCTQSPTYTTYWRTPVTTNSHLQPRPISDAWFMYESDGRNARAISLFELGFFLILIIVRDNKQKRPRP